MPSLKNSLLESFYLIFMFLFFKTSIDFNVLSSPKGSWLEHLIGDEYGLRICPFGRVAIFALIFILIARHYIKIPDNFMIFALSVSFILSLINLNAVVYLIPVWLLEMNYLF
jgi:hypothetical protein|uniref:Uncharacterized protein n=1 Tax=viral metagenome TaxID=1070528 RepID=A0A6C0IQV7_9ZZZZ